MSKWEKFKKWLKTQPAGYIDWAAVHAEDKKEQKEISSGLDKFKYRTLSTRLGLMKIWKEDSSHIMSLSNKEAKQMLIYLQFSHSEVPKYAIKKIDPKLQSIRAIAEKYEYKEVALQTSPPMISFKKGADRINIFHTTMSVGTCINHPKKGKTQLFRKKVSLKMLDTIFKNPRQHTGKGYYTN